MAVYPGSQFASVNVRIFRLPHFLHPICFHACTTLTSSCNPLQLHPRYCPLGHRYLILSTKLLCSLFVFSNWNLVFTWRHCSSCSPCKWWFFSFLLPVLGPASQRGCWSSSVTPHSSPSSQLLTWLLLLTISTISISNPLSLFQNRSGMGPFLNNFHLYRSVSSYPHLPLELL